MDDGGDGGVLASVFGNSNVGDGEAVTLPATGPSADASAETIHGGRYGAPGGVIGSGRIGSPGKAMIGVMEALPGGRPRSSAKSPPSPSCLPGLGRGSTSAPGLGTAILVMALLLHRAVPMLPIVRPMCVLPDWHRDRGAHPSSTPKRVLDNGFDGRVLPSAGRAP